MTQAAGRDEVGRRFLDGWTRAGMYAAVFGALLVVVGLTTRTTAGTTTAQVVPLHNDSAHSDSDDCPPGPDPSWHFILAPNNGTFRFVTIVLNLDGTIVTYDADDLILNAGQRDNVFAIVPDGYALDDLRRTGSFAEVTPYGTVRFVLSHVCAGTSATTTTTVPGASTTTSTTVPGGSTTTTTAPGGSTTTTTVPGGSTTTTTVPDTTSTTTTTVDQRPPTTTTTTTVPADTTTTTTTTVPADTTTTTTVADTTTTTTTTVEQRPPTSSTTTTTSSTTTSTTTSTSTTTTTTVPGGTTTTSVEQRPAVTTTTTTPTTTTRPTTTTTTPRRTIVVTGAGPSRTLIGLGMLMVLVGTSLVLGGYTRRTRDVTGDVAEE